MKPNNTQNETLTKKEVYDILILEMLKECERKHTSIENKNYFDPMTSRILCNCGDNLEWYLK